LAYFLTPKFNSILLFAFKSGIYTLSKISMCFIFGELVLDLFDYFGDRLRLAALICSTNFVYFGDD